MAVPFSRWNAIVVRFGGESIGFVGRYRYVSDLCLCQLLCCIRSWL